MADKTDLQKAVELIGKSNDVLLTTHTRPDGDACGCIVAIREALTGLGKSVKILLLSELPAWYEFLFTRPTSGGLKQKSAAERRDLVLPRLASARRAEGGPKIFSKKTKIDSDLIIIVDTDAYNQLPELEKYLKQTDKPVLVIDHHATSDNIGNVRLIDSSAAATALIVFDLLKYAGFPVTKKIAEALFVAVSTDTGWFQFGNTDSRTLKVCAELIDSGASPSQIYRELYQNFSPQRFMLLAAMLNTLQLWRLVNGKWKLVTTNYKLPITKYQLPIFAMQHLSQADFKRTGAKLSDTENLIDECRRISSVEAAALFVEQADGQVKVSLRSRGAVDVCKIAVKFGGGGHKMAAGAHLPGPLENAKKLIFNAVAEQFKQSI